MHASIHAHAHALQQVSHTVQRLIQLIYNFLNKGSPHPFHGRMLSECFQYAWICMIKKRQANHFSHLRTNMSVKLVSLGRITELLPNKYVLGSDNVEAPANSDLVLTIAGANDEANLQQFYLGKNTETPTYSEGFLATYHLKYVLQVTAIQESGGWIVHYFPVPPDDPIVHDGKYPKWVTPDMLFTLKPTGEENTYSFFSKSSSTSALGVRYSQDTINSLVLVYPLKSGNDLSLKFKTQYPVPPL